MKEEGKSLGYHCCFLKIKNEKDTCFPVNKTQYDNIDKYIDNYEKLHNITVLSFDCKSDYIKIGLLSLLYLLL